MVVVQHVQSSLDTYEMMDRQRQKIHEHYEHQDSIQIAIKKYEKQCEETVKEREMKIEMTETQTMEMDVVLYEQSNQTIFVMEVQHHRLIRVQLALQDYTRTQAKLLVRHIVETANEQVLRLEMMETQTMEMDVVLYEQSNQTIFVMEVQHHRLIRVQLALQDYTRTQAKLLVRHIVETANEQVLRLEMMETQTMEMDVVLYEQSNQTIFVMEVQHHRLIRVQLALQDYTRTQAKLLVRHIVETANEQVLRLEMMETQTMEMDVVLYEQSNQTIFVMEVQHHRLIRVQLALQDYTRTQAKLLVRHIVETANELVLRLEMMETQTMEMDVVLYEQSNQTIFVMEVQHHRLIRVQLALQDYTRTQAKLLVRHIVETANEQVLRLEMMETQTMEMDVVLYEQSNQTIFVMEVQHHHLIRVQLALQDYTRTQAKLLVRHIVETANELVLRLEMMETQTMEMDVVLYEQSNQTIFVMEVQHHRLIRVQLALQDYTRTQAKLLVRHIVETANEQVLRLEMMETQTMEMDVVLYEQSNQTIFVMEVQHHRLIRVQLALQDYTRTQAKLLVRHIVETANEQVLRLEMMETQTMEMDVVLYEQSNQTIFVMEVQHHRLIRVQLALQDYTRTQAKLLVRHIVETANEQVLRLEMMETQTMEMDVVLYEQSNQTIFVMEVQHHRLIRVQLALQDYTRTQAKLLVRHIVETANEQVLRLEMMETQTMEMDVVLYEQSNQTIFVMEVQHHRLIRVQLALQDYTRTQAKLLVRHIVETANEQVLRLEMMETQTMEMDVVLYEQSNQTIFVMEVQHHRLIRVQLALQDYTRTQAKLLVRHIVETANEQVLRLEMMETQTMEMDVVLYEQSNQTIFVMEVQHHRLIRVQLALQDYTRTQAKLLVRHIVETANEQVLRLEMMETQTMEMDVVLYEQSNQTIFVMEVQHHRLIRVQLALQDYTRTQAKLLVRHIVETANEQVLRLEMMETQTMEMDVVLYEQSNQTIFVMEVQHHRLIRVQLALQDYTRTQAKLLVRHIVETANEQVLRLEMMETQTMEMDVVLYEQSNQTIFVMEVQHHRLIRVQLALQDYTRTQAKLLVRHIVETANEQVLRLEMMETQTMEMDVVLYEQSNQTIFVMEVQHHRLIRVQLALQDYTRTQAKLLVRHIVETANEQVLRLEMMETQTMEMDVVLYEQSNQTIFVMEVQHHRLIRVQLALQDYTRTQAKLLVRHIVETANEQVLRLEMMETQTMEMDVVLYEQSNQTIFVMEVQHHRLIRVQLALQDYTRTQAKLLVRHIVETANEQVLRLEMMETQTMEMDVVLYEQSNQTIFVMEVQHHRLIRVQLALQDYTRTQAKLLVRHIVETANEQVLRLEMMETQTMEMDVVLYEQSNQTIFVMEVQHHRLIRVQLALQDYTRTQAKLLVRHIVETANEQVLRLEMMETQTMEMDVVLYEQSNQTIFVMEVQHHRLIRVQLALQDYTRTQAKLLVRHIVETANEQVLRLEMMETQTMEMDVVLYEQSNQTIFVMEVQHHRLIRVQLALQDYTRTQAKLLVRHIVETANEQVLRLEMMETQTMEMDVVLYEQSNQTIFVMEVQHHRLIRVQLALQDYTRTQAKLLVRHIVETANEQVLRLEMMETQTMEMDVVLYEQSNQTIFVMEVQHHRLIRVQLALQDYTRTQAKLLVRHIVETANEQVLRLEMMETQTMEMDVVLYEQSNQTIFVMEVQHHRLIRVQLALQDYTRTQAKLLVRHIVETANEQVLRLEMMETQTMEMDVVLYEQSNQTIFVMEVQHHRLIRVQLALQDYTRTQAKLLVRHIVETANEQVLRLEMMETQTMEMDVVLYEQSNQTIFVMEVQHHRLIRVQLALQDYTRTQAKLLVRHIVETANEQVLRLEMMETQTMEMDVVLYEQSNQTIFVMEVQHHRLIRVQLALQDYTRTQAKLLVRHIVETANEQVLRLEMMETQTMEMDVVLYEQSNQTIFVMEVQHHRLIRVQLALQDYTRTQAKLLVRHIVETANEQVLRLEMMETQTMEMDVVLYEQSNQTIFVMEVQHHRLIRVQLALQDYTRTQAKLLVRHIVETANEQVLRLEMMETQTMEMDVVLYEQSNQTIFVMEVQHHRLIRVQLALQDYTRTQAKLLVRHIVETANEQVLRLEMMETQTMEMDVVLYEQSNQTIFVMEVQHHRLIRVQLALQDYTRTQAKLLVRHIVETANEQVLRLEMMETQTMEMDVVLYEQSNQTIFVMEVQHHRLIRVQLALQDYTRTQAKLLVRHIVETANEQVLRLEMMETQTMEMDVVLYEQSNQTIFVMEVQHHRLIRVQLALQDYTRTQAKLLVRHIVETANEQVLRLEMMETQTMEMDVVLYEQSNQTIFVMEVQHHRLIRVQLALQDYTRTQAKLLVRHIVETANEQVLRLEMMETQTMEMDVVLYEQSNQTIFVMEVQHHRLIRVQLALQDYTRTQAKLLVRHIVETANEQVLRLEMMETQTMEMDVVLYEQSNQTIFVMEVQHHRLIRVQLALQDYTRTQAKLLVRHIVETANEQVLRLEMMETQTMEMDVVLYEQSNQTIFVMEVQHHRLIRVQLALQDYTRTQAKLLVRHIVETANEQVLRLEMMETQTMEMDVVLYEQSNQTIFVMEVQHHRLIRVQLALQDYTRTQAKLLVRHIVETANEQVLRLEMMETQTMEMDVVLYEQSNQTIFVMEVQHHRLIRVQLALQDYTRTQAKLLVRHIVETANEQVLRLEMMETQTMEMDVVLYEQSNQTIFVMEVQHHRLIRVQLALQDYTRTQAKLLVRHIVETANEQVLRLEMMETQTMEMDVVLYEQSNQTIFVMEVQHHRLIRVQLALQDYTRTQAKLLVRHIVETANEQVLRLEMMETQTMEMDVVLYEQSNQTIFVMEVQHHRLIRVQLALQDYTRTQAKLLVRHIVETANEQVLRLEMMETQTMEMDVVLYEQSNQTIFVMEVQHHRLIRVQLALQDYTRTQAKLLVRHIVETANEQVLRLEMMETQTMEMDVVLYEQSNQTIFVMEVQHHRLIRVQLALQDYTRTQAKLLVRHIVETANEQVLRLEMMETQTMEMDVVLYEQSNQTIFVMEVQHHRLIRVQLALQDYTRTQAKLLVRHIVETANEQVLRLEMMETQTMEMDVVLYEQSNQTIFVMEVQHHRLIRVQLVLQDYTRTQAKLLVRHIVETANEQVLRLEMMETQTMEMDVVLYEQSNQTIFVMEVQHHRLIRVQLALQDYTRTQAKLLVRHIVETANEQVLRLEMMETQTMEMDVVLYEQSNQTIFVMEVQHHRLIRVQLVLQDYTRTQAKLLVRHIVETANEQVLRLEMMETQTMEMDVVLYEQSNQTIFVMEVQHHRLIRVQLALQDYTRTQAKLLVRHIVETANEQVLRLEMMETQMMEMDVVLYEQSNQTIFVMEVQHHRLIRVQLALQDYTRTQAKLLVRHIVETANEQVLRLEMMETQTMEMDVVLYEQSNQTIFVMEVQHHRLIRVQLALQDYTRTQAKLLVRHIVETANEQVLRLEMMETQTMEMDVVLYEQSNQTIFVMEVQHHRLIRVQLVLQDYTRTQAKLLVRHIVETANEQVLRLEMMETQTMEMDVVLYEQSNQTIFVMEVQHHRLIRVQLALQDYTRTQAKLLVRHIVETANEQVLRLEMMETQTMEMDVVLYEQSNQTIFVMEVQHHRLIRVQLALQDYTRTQAKLLVRHIVETANEQVLRLEMMETQTMEMDVVLYEQSNQTIFVMEVQHHRLIRVQLALQDYTRTQAKLLVRHIVETANEQVLRLEMMETQTMEMDVVLYEQSNQTIFVMEVQHHRLIRVQLALQDYTRTQAKLLVRHIVETANEQVLRLEMMETQTMEMDVVLYEQSNQTIFVMEVQHHRLIRVQLALQDYTRTQAKLLVRHIVETANEQVLRLEMMETQTMEMDVVLYEQSNQTIFVMEVQHHRLIFVMLAQLDYPQIYLKPYELYYVETANDQAQRLAMMEIH